jgi:MFS transporter, MHS family, proline/betaine transporter
MLVFVVCTASYALISTTITSYPTTFLTSVGHLASSGAYNVTIVSNVLVIAGALAVGLVCDRIGLRRMLVLAGIVTALLAVPALALAASGIGGGYLGAALVRACKGLLAVPTLPGGRPPHPCTRPGLGRRTRHLRRGNNPAAPYDFPGGRKRPRPAT